MAFKANERKRSPKAGAMAAAILAMSSVALVACEMTLYEWPPPGQPPANATAPLTVPSFVYEAGIFGTEALKTKQEIFGRIHFVDEVKIQLPLARFLGISEPMDSRAMLVPGRRNCVSVRFTREEALFDPVYLGRAIFPIYPREGDVLTLTPSFSKAILRIVLKNQHGDLYFEQENIRYFSRVGQTPLYYQPEVSKEDIDTCYAMLSPKTPTFEEDW